jgi:hypothetical protein
MRGRFPRVSALFKFAKVFPSEKPERQIPEV